MKLHIYTVEGEGWFPCSMLAHARAWPSTADDASSIGHQNPRRGVKRRVKLESFDPVPLDAWRWAEWPVIESTTVEV